MDGTKRVVGFAFPEECRDPYPTPKRRKKGTLANAPLWHFGRKRGGGSGGGFISSEVDKGEKQLFKTRCKQKEI